MCHPKTAKDLEKDLMGDNRIVITTMQKFSKLLLPDEGSGDDDVEGGVFGKDNRPIAIVSCHIRHHLVIAYFPLIFVDI